MTARTPRRAVMSQCEQLPGAELCFPFGDDAAVFKVGGKMFAILDVARDLGAVTLKCDPEEAAARCRSEQGVAPGYHMNKRHWITVAPGLVSRELLADLVQGSYEIVVASLPRGRRPSPA